MERNGPELKIPAKGGIPASKTVGHSQAQSSECQAEIAVMAYSVPDWWQDMDALT